MTSLVAYANTKDIDLRGWKKLSGASPRYSQLAIQVSPAGGDAVGILPKSPDVDLACINQKLLVYRLATFADFKKCV